MAHSTYSKSCNIYIYTYIYIYICAKSSVITITEVQSVAFGGTNRSEIESNWKRIFLTKNKQKKTTMGFRCHSNIKSPLLNRYTAEKISWHFNPNFYRKSSEKTWWSPQSISGRLETTTLWSSVSLIKLHRPALQTSWRDLGRWPLQSVPGFLLWIVQIQAK